MKHKFLPIQARNTILARDIADRLSAQANEPVSVSTCLELVAAACGFGSYAAYTQAVKDKTEPTDFKKAQLWLLEPKVVGPRIASLGLVGSLDTASLALALQRVADELMANYPDCSLVVECSPSVLSEDALEKNLTDVITDAINDALNPKPITQDDLVDQDLDLSVACGTLSVDKVGPLPEKVKGWLRASVYGKAERETPRSIHADSDDMDYVEFTARIRLLRIGKQLYAGCRAEILVLDNNISEGIKPDVWTDPDDLAAMIGTSDAT